MYEIFYNNSGWRMSNFKASDYSNYNRKLGFTKYKYLYSLMEELFTLLPFDEKNYEDDSFFVFSGNLFPMLSTFPLFFAFG